MWLEKKNVEQNYLQYLKNQTITTCQEWLYHCKLDDITWNMPYHCKLPKITRPISQSKSVEHLPMELVIHGLSL